MSTMKPSSPRPALRLTLRPAPRRGYMMMLVLVTLVAMTISGIALIRSMDTNQVVSGNMAFRNATVHSGDLAVQNAVAWINATKVVGGALDATSVGNGYSAQESEPDWSQPALWTACAACSAVDAAGNNVSYLIHRMCTMQGSPSTPGNFCSSTISTITGSGNSTSSDAYQFAGSAKYFYRITVRAMGPRNTVTLSQAFITL